MLVLLGLGILLELLMLLGLLMLLRVSKGNPQVFQQKNYTENFVQATLSALGEQLEGATLVVGGDGRFFMTEATDIIIKMAAANKVARLIVGKGGFLSTPAVSNLIR